MWTRSAGVLILDVKTPAKPEVVCELEWEPGQGGATHTTVPLPERKLLAVVDEALSYRPLDLFPPDHLEYREISVQPNPENPKFLRVVDIADERNPRVL